MLIADLAARPRATDAVYLMVRPDPPAARQFGNLEHSRIGWNR
jgi:hypothetical protein